jgi:hypothetical protein
MASTFLGVALGFATVGGSAAKFGSDEPGVATDEGRLHIALPLVNLGTDPASDVQVDRVALRAHEFLGPMLPLAAGDLEAGEEIVLQLSFERKRIFPAKSFQIIVAGSHRVDGRFGPRRRRFRVTRRIFAPQPDDGERRALEAVVEARTVDGADFPPTTLERPIAEEPEGRPLPTGGVVADPRPDNPSVAVSVLPPRGLPVRTQAEDVVFVRGTDERLTPRTRKAAFPGIPAGRPSILRRTSGWCSSPVTSTRFCRRMGGRRSPTSTPRRSSATSRSMACPRTRASAAT